MVGGSLKAFSEGTVFDVNVSLLSMIVASSSIQLDMMR